MIGDPPCKGNYAQCVKRIMSIRGGISSAWLHAYRMISQIIGILERHEGKRALDSHSNMDIIVFTVDIFNDVRTDLFQIFLGRCDRDKKKEKAGKKNDDSFHIE